MAQEKKTLVERIVSAFRRKPQVQELTENKVITKPADKEAELRDLVVNLNTSKLNAVSVDVSKLTEEELNAIYDQMDTDPIVSSVLDLYADNATQENKLTGVAVYVKVPNDQNLEDSINAFLQKEVNIDFAAWSYVRDLAKYGKVIIDTEPTQRTSEWVFSTVKDPSTVYPLTYGNSRVKYFLAQEEQKQDEIHKYWSIAGREQNETTYSVQYASRYIYSLNNRQDVGTVVVKTENKNGKETEETLQMQSGKSILYSVIADWQTLKSLEDSLFINRLTKSTEFKIVEIDVTGMNNAQAIQTIDSIKSAFKLSTSLDEEAKTYRSRQSPIPINDFVYIPKKSDRGAITITPVGGDVGDVKMDDINHFRNKVFAGLGGLKAFHGFEETTTGGLGDNTITRLDERQGRRVKRFQQLLKEIVEQFVEYYWLNSDPHNRLEKLPEYEVILGEINSVERDQLREEVQANLETARNFINIASEDLFSDYIDKKKLFEYVFNNILNIDTNLITASLDTENIDVRIKQLDEKNFELVEQLVQELEETQKELQEEKKKILSEKVSLYKKLKHQDNNKELNEFEKKYKELQEETKNYLKETDIYLIKNNKKVLLETLLETSNNLLRKYLSEKTYKELRQAVKTRDPERFKKSKRSVATYKGLDENNYITFQITAENPEENKAKGKPTSYEVKIELSALKELIGEDGKQRDIKDLTLVREALNGNIKVSCTCPAAKWWGQQWNGTKQGYSLVKNDIAPTRNIPTQVICKHTMLALQVLPFWASNIVQDLRKKKVL